MTRDDVIKQDNGPLVPFEQWMGRTALPFVPRAMTANHVTMLSGSCGVLAGLAFYLASFHDAWFLVGAVLVLAQWWADNTDGHVARSRQQASPAGRFLQFSGGEPSRNLLRSVHPALRIELRAALYQAAQTAEAAIVPPVRSARHDSRELFLREHGRTPLRNMSAAHGTPMKESLT